MYDILILSHGHLAEGFYRTMEMIFGEEPKIRWASLMEGESPEEFGKKLEERVDWESTCGLLVLCDLFGGSPCMGAVSRLMDCGKKWRMVAGINLPMIMEAYSRRGEDLYISADALLREGCSNIVDVNARLAQGNYDVDEDE